MARSLENPLLALALSAGITISGAAEIPFSKQILSAEYFCDGANTGDFNRDGAVDIVAGPFWYAGPDFQEKQAFYPPVAWPPEASPSNSMFSYVWDFDGDGWDDILVLGRVHLHAAAWYRNPQGASGLWEKHTAFPRVRGESPPFVDVDQDGRPELVAHWDNRWGLIQPNWDAPTELWTFHPISESGEWKQFYHGTGVGDLTGDGRPDIVINDGYWEQPGDNFETTWAWRPFLFGENGGAQIGIFDIDGDGDADVVTALNAHLWGLSWFENIGLDQKKPFIEHKIMGNRQEETTYGVAFSQPHALDFADINGDGLLDVVTGKRLWAHGPTGDVEPNGTPVNYWFELRRNPSETRFIPHLIDNASGLGVQVIARDVTGDGKTDVLAASKLGTFLFRQE